MNENSSSQPEDVAASVVRRIADDLAWLANRTLHVDRMECDRRQEARPVGEGVSIGFRFAVEQEGRKHEGLLSMPLAEAIMFSAGLLGYDPKETLIAGALDAPTQELKAGMVELSKFVAKAAKVQLSRSLHIPTQAEGRSCVGLRAGSVPQVQGSHGFVTVQAEWSFHGRDPFEIQLSLDTLAFGPEERMGLAA
ncbi:MAG: hypothetical protein AAF368_02695 [Planctomycetota bacterium]